MPRMTGLFPTDASSTQQKHVYTFKNVSYWHHWLKNCWAFHPLGIVIFFSLLLWKRGQTFLRVCLHGRSCPIIGMWDCQAISRPSLEGPGTICFDAGGPFSRHCKTFCFPPAAWCRSCCSTQPARRASAAYGSLLMGQQHFAFDINHLQIPSQRGASPPCFLLLRAAPDVLYVHWEEPAQ